MTTRTQTIVTATIEELTDELIKSNIKTAISLNFVKNYGFVHALNDFDFRITKSKINENEEYIATEIEYILEEFVEAVEATENETV